MIVLCILSHAWPACTCYSLDRHDSVETISLLAALKLRYPRPPYPTPRTHPFLLRSHLLVCCPSQSHKQTIPQHTIPLSHLHCLYPQPHPVPSTTILALPLTRLLPQESDPAAGQSRVSRYHTGLSPMPQHIPLGIPQGIPRVLHTMPHPQLHHFSLRGTVHGSGAQSIALLG